MTPSALGPYKPTGGDDHGVRHLHIGLLSIFLNLALTNLCVAQL
jgi:hypothetical protein